jgi:hypothetical protein
MPVSSPVAQRPGRRPLSLAHLSLIEATPSQLLRIAGEAGFDLANHLSSPSAMAPIPLPRCWDLVGIVGYYTFNAMMLNTARYKPADGTAIPHFPQ